MIQVGVQTFKRAEAQLPIPTVPLEPEHLNLVNVAMNTRSKTKRWHHLLQSDVYVSMVLYDALFCASTALQSTSLRDRFIAPDSETRSNSSNGSPGSRVE